MNKNQKCNYNIAYQFKQQLDTIKPAWQFSFSIAELIKMLPKMYSEALHP